MKINPTMVVLARDRKQENTERKATWRQKQRSE